MKSRTKPNPLVGIMFNFPATVRAKLRAVAEKRGQTMTVVVLEALRKAGIK